MTITLTRDGMTSTPRKIEAWRNDTAVLVLQSEGAHGNVVCSVDADGVHWHEVNETGHSVGLERDVPVSEYDRLVVTY